MHRGVIASAIAAIAMLLLACATAAQAENPAPALWKIDGPNGDVFLFGSIHVLPEGVKWRGRDLESALVRAERLIFELDMEAARDPAGRSALIRKHGVLKEGESLRAMLAPEHRERVEAVATSLGLKFADIDHMRPWLAAVTLNSLAIIKQNSVPAPAATPSADTPNAPGVDAQLWAWSKVAGKGRGALETAEDQIRAYSDLSREQEIEYLVVTLQNARRSSETLGSIVDAWAAGDTKRLNNAFNASLDSYPALRDALLRKRHERWLPQIERLISDGGTHVIVVGAAHLVGNDSVVAMLRARGITVEGP